MALDADGVFQVGVHLGVDLFDGKCSCPESTLMRFRRLEASHLVVPGFAAALSNLENVWGCPGSVLLQRHCELDIDFEVLRVVHAARGRFAGVVLATNQTRERLDAMLSFVGKGWFDACVASCEVGAAKPSSRYFEELLTRVRVLPDEVVFIDDRIENVEAARTMGMRGIRFPRLAGAPAMARLLDELA